MTCQLFLWLSAICLCAVVVSASPFVKSSSTAVYGSYLVPAGASHDLCAAYLGAVPDQCSPPDLAKSESLCAADVNCGGVNCHSDDTVCTLRYYPLTTPASNSDYSFYAKDTPSYHFVTRPNAVLYGTAAPPASSDALCTLFKSAVQGQCTPPTLAAAQELCGMDSNCGGVNCHSDNTVCTLRYFPLTPITTSDDYNAYVKKTPFEESAGTAVYGSYVVPAGASQSLCANYLRVVQDQCAPPSLEAAQSLCAADFNCGGVNCHSDDTVCTLRYRPLTSPTPNTDYNFYSKRTHTYRYLPLFNHVLYGTAAVPKTSTALCEEFSSAVEGQCSPPTLDAAEELCSMDENCGGVNCHSDNTVCTLRYTPLSQPQANTDYNMFVKKL